MKKLKWTIILLFVCLMHPLFAGAQTVQTDKVISSDGDVINWNDDYLLDNYELRDNWFYSFHLGSFINWGTTAPSLQLNSIRPSLGFSVGKWLYPQGGLRLQLLYGNNRGEINSRGYYWHTAELACDVVVNMSNIVKRYRENTRFNVLLLAGIGGDQTFGFSKRDWNNDKKAFSPYDCSLLTFRAGFALLYQISKKWDICLEVVNNWVDDSYDGVIDNNRWDGHVNANISLVRRLKNRDNGHKFKYLKNDLSKVSQANQRINQLHEEAEVLRNIPPADVVGGKQVNVLVSFADSTTVIDHLQEVNVYTAAQAMLQNGNRQNLYITTLSDMTDELFLKRAEVVSQSLTQQYGIPADHIIIIKNHVEAEQRDKLEGSVIVFINENISQN